MRMLMTCAPGCAHTTWARSGMSDRMQRKVGDSGDSATKRFNVETHACVACVCRPDVHNHACPAGDTGWLPKHPSFPPHKTKKEGETHIDVLLVVIKNLIASLLQVSNERGFSTLSGRKPVSCRHGFAARAVVSVAAGSAFSTPCTSEESGELM